MVTAILAGILTVNTLNPHEMEYSTFSAGFSSSSKSLSSSSSLCPWLRAAKMFPPWKRPEMLYRVGVWMLLMAEVKQSVCECWQTFFLLPLLETVTVEAKDKYIETASYTLWGKRMILFYKYTWILITCFHWEFWQCQHDIFIICIVTFSFPPIFLFFLRLEKNSNVTSSQNLKDTVSGALFRIQDQFELSDTGSFSAGLFNLQAGRWIAPSHAFEWAGIQCEKGWRGANKKNSLRDTISNSGKMFLSFCPC